MPLKSHSFCYWLLFLELLCILVPPVVRWPLPSETFQLKKSTKTRMFQERITFISHYYCFFMTVTSHPKFCPPWYLHSCWHTDPDLKISPEFVPLPVLRQFFTISSKTSGGTVISTAGPLSALSIRHVFFQLFWIKKQHLLQEVLG